ncbi:hypothetical protein VHEMI04196 [[Torrubiella] hemipterigena]|uniref:Uncharacterized protein n=1 Tax=[Torrubiella] hemipterigena TaxID=1531966 RepID=A0A0A1T0K9_9HYPO|nr:hypothetical protein VHEMI04196 [[Torrubiella] hemipterigena]
MLPLLTFFLVLATSLVSARPLHQQVTVIRVDMADYPQRHEGRILTFFQSFYEGPVPSREPSSLWACNDEFTQAFCRGSSTSLSMLQVLIVVCVIAAVAYSFMRLAATCIKMDEKQTAAKQAPFPADEKQPLVTDTTKPAL